MLGLAVALLQPTLWAAFSAGAPVAKRNGTVAVAVHAAVGVVLVAGTVVLGVRIAVRYSVWLVCAVAAGSTAWVQLWQLIVRGTNCNVDVAVKYLPWALLSAPLARGVFVAGLVWFAPWTTMRNDSRYHDVLPTAVLAVMGGLAAVCLDLSSIMTARRHKDFRADMQGFLVRQQAAADDNDVTSYVVARTPYWVMLLPSSVGVGTTSPADAALWSHTASYADQTVVALDETNGGLPTTRLYYVSRGVAFVNGSTRKGVLVVSPLTLHAWFAQRAVGDIPTGYHPRCVRSRLLQILFTEPIRVVRTATILMVVLVGATGELVLLLQRWQLYAGLMSALFVALLTTYVRAYRVMVHHEELLAAQRRAMTPTPLT